MRAIVFAVILSFLFNSTLNAYEQGDLMIVVAGHTTVKLAESETEKLSKLTLLRFRSVKETGLEVIGWSMNGEKFVGIVQPEDVHPLTESTKMIDAIISASPTASAYYARAMARREQLQLDAAIEDFNQAINLAPDHLKALRNRAYTWELLGEWDKSIVDLTRAIQIDSDNPEVFVERARVWPLAGNWDGAIADFDEAIRLDPLIADAFFYRADAFFKKRDLSNAIASYTHAIRLNPGNIEYLNRRAHAWRDHGEIDKAIADLTAAIRLDESHVDSHVRRSYLWQLKHEWGAAIADLNEAIRLDPKNTTNYITRGKCWDSKGEPTKAIADYEVAMRLAPHDAQRDTYLKHEMFRLSFKAYAKDGIAALAWIKKEIALAVEKEKEKLDGK